MAKKEIEAVVVSARELRDSLIDEEPDSYFLTLTPDCPFENFVLLGESFEKRQGTYNKDTRCFDFFVGRRAKVSKKLIEACVNKAAEIYVRCVYRVVDGVEVPWRLLETVDLSALDAKRAAARKRAILRSEGSTPIVEDGVRLNVRWKPMSDFIIAKPDQGLPLANDAVLQSKIDMLNDELNKQRSLLAEKLSLEG